jgi:FADH2 O2-dependent halogenase
MHLFDGGWMWVIPFNNHPSSTNQLCSVGLNMDPRRHPKPDLPPEQEFRAFIRSFPAMAQQFEKAIAIREWVSSDRLQFSSTRAVGDRYCLIPHAFALRRSAVLERPGDRDMGDQHADRPAHPGCEGR